ncbi:MAG: hypothetical protein JO019_00835 [Candidatus Kaiserbacteria bacterium]|nr:hypothetical protein [Candidatus Kaiserbacteria bacterium]
MKHIKISIDKRILVLTAVLVICIAFSIVYVAYGATPNPGHPWTDIGNGTWQVANTQTGLRTFTFPDADATVFTSANASTTQFSFFTKAYFGATATSTFDSTGALTLATPLAAGSGGTGVNSLGTGIATFLQTPSSANFSAAMTDETGSAGSIVFSVGPTFTGTTKFANASSTIDSCFGPCYFGATATSSFSTAGALTLATPLALTSGGTNASLSAVNGGVVYSNASALAVSAAGSTGQYFQSAGAGTPVWVTGKIFLGRQVKVNGNTTYTPTAGTTAVLIQMCAGGGGGGGATGAATPTASVGAGGGSGSYLEKYVTFSTTAASYVIAVGAGGTAGAAANGAGGNGGNTTFACDANCSSGAVTFTANGGTGAPAANTAGTSVLASLGGAGGVVSTNGDVNETGQPGQPAQRFTGSTGVSGNGAPSHFGGGGNSVNATAASATAGNAAGGNCAGGSGAVSAGVATAVTGGAGGAGIMVIWEFR